MDRVEVYLKRCYLNRKEKRLLVICGENGVGKSHIARSAARYISAVAVSAWSSGKWPQVMRVEIRPWSEFAGLDAKERGGIWQDLVESDFLVLDDVGSEVDQFKSGRPLENLRLMLDAREGRWTMITTNVMPERWADTWDLRVTDRLMRCADAPIIMRSSTSYAAQTYRQPYTD